MIGATFCVGAVARHLAAAQHSHHQDSVRWLAMLAFVLSGPVMFTGHLATYDAACVLGVAVAFRLALCGNGALSAAGAGAAIAVATVCKYTGGGFIPVMVALALLSTPLLRRNLVRTGALVGSAGAILLAVYLPSADFITTGIEFTTVSRQAHNYRSYDLLISELLRGIGIVALLALVGALVLQSQARSVRSLLINLVMAGAALAIPVSQLRIHEYTSFDKHLAYSALFLAPLAGQVTRLPRPAARIAAIAVGVYLLAVTALYRADFMFNEWPDSTKVVKTIQAEGGAGTYLGVGADSMGYYSKAYPNLAWEEPWVLFGAGHAAIRQAVETRHYAGIVVTSGTSASAELDGSIAYLTSLLKHDPDYRLAGSWPKHQYDENKFFLYLRR